MPSEQPRYPEPLRRDVRGYPWCVECGDRTVLQPRCPDCLPAQPQPREGTRVCEHAHEGNICPICEPAQPQPRGEEARVGGRIQEGALSAVRTPTNPPVESRLVPLAPPRGEGEWRSDEEAQALIDAIKGEPAPEGEGEAS